MSIKIKTIKNLFRNQHNNFYQRKFIKIEFIHNFIILSHNNYMKKNFKEALYSTNLKDIEKNLSQFLQFKKQESIERQNRRKEIINEENSEK